MPAERLHGEGHLGHWDLGTAERLWDEQGQHPLPAQCFKCLEREARLAVNVRGRGRGKVQTDLRGDGDDVPLGWRREAELRTDGGD